MAIAFNWGNRSDDTTTNAVTTFNVGATNPNGANGTFTSGDFLLAVIILSSSSTTDPGAIAMTGWTNIFADWDATTETRIEVWFKIAGGAESGSYAASWTNTSRGASWALLDYTGVATTSPADITGSQVTSGSTSCTAPSVTAVASNDLLFYIGSNYGAHGPMTVPAGMAQRTNQSGSDSTRPSVMTADIQLVSAGATGTKVGTLNSAGDNKGVNIALKTASAGAVALVSTFLMMGV